MQSSGFFIFTDNRGPILSYESVSRLSSHRLEDDQDHLWLVLRSVKCVPAASPCHCMITREIRRLGKCHQMEGVGAAANNGLKWVPWVE